MRWRRPLLTSGTTWQPTKSTRGPQPVRTNQTETSERSCLYPFRVSMWNSQPERRPAKRITLDSGRATGHQCHVARREIDRVALKPGGRTERFARRERTLRSSTRNSECARAVGGRRSTRRPMALTPKPRRRGARRPTRAPQRLPQQVPPPCGRDENQRAPEAVTAARGRRCRAAQRGPKRRFSPTIRPQACDQNRRRGRNRDNRPDTRR